MATNWIENKHPEYLECAADYRFTADYYSGDVLKTANLRKYLVKRVAGESEEAYEERYKLADLTNHFAVIVDSLNGMVAQIESDANRMFQPKDATRGLGATDDPDSPIGRLWKDAGSGNGGYLSTWRVLGANLTLHRRAWIFVDPAEGEPRIRVFSPMEVINWRYADDGITLTDVVIQEKYDGRGSIQANAAAMKQYLHLHTQGWDRYSFDSRGSQTVSGSGKWTFKTPSGVLTVPVVDATLALKRAVGWTLAKKQHAIFNQESSRDNLIRLANHPRLNLVGSNDLFDKIVISLRTGGAVLQNDPASANLHGYIAPSADPATSASAVIKEKVQDLYITGFREYGDSARERTATEHRQTTASGIGAFLQFLSDALDSAENRTLYLLEQALFPATPQFIGVAHVERSQNFMPVDPDAVIDRLAKRAFGESKDGVPIGRSARIEAAKHIAEYQGLPVNEDEIAREVDLDLVQNVLATTDTLQIPAEARAELVIQLLTSAGVDKPENYRESAIALAQAHDEAMKMAGQGFGGIGG